jgi:hypothetical protein
MCGAVLFEGRLGIIVACTEITPIFLVSIDILLQERQQQFSRTYSKVTSSSMSGPVVPSVALLDQNRLCFSQSPLNSMKASTCDGERVLRRAGLEVA